MKPCIAPVYAVISIGVGKKVEVLASGYEGIDHFHGILKVHVVVGRSVHQEQGALEFVGEA